MPTDLVRGVPRRFAFRELIFVFVCFMSLHMLPANAKQQDSAIMGDMPGMDHGAMTMDSGQESPEALAQRLGGKHESEFNHHLAGLLVFCAGLFVLLEQPLANYWPRARYVWPICFLAAGFFVLLFSDLEIWPLGNQTPWYALTHSTEILQHKLFAAILLSLGYVEIQRARGRFNGFWTALFFPVVGIAGAILLLFHVHGGDMSAPNAMKTMEHIETQHHWFAAVGVGISISKGLAEIPQKLQLVFSRIWPALLICLGILLIVYTE